MATWNPQANDLFLKALALRLPVARQEYIDEACAGDAALRTEVEALLEAHDRAGSFLDQPAVAGGPTGDFAAVPGIEAATNVARECAGTVIGPYKLLQQIGEGGMGTVFMAEQSHPIQRKVALKVIKAGMDSKQVIARFEAERQALALMDHVNIARVFDAGATEAGRPYFVMELVYGVPITTYCDDNHLTPRERLELFVRVCQAIQHAHQKGIIHRDIKPSNVMVTLYDGKPVPKVIDFGVAKATEQKLTERTLFTQYGTMVGTLEYMSPEQAEMSALGVDTRSDIYSLGVLLYELLTGSTPLTHKRMKEAAYAEILRMIKEEEPQKPSTRLSDSGEALASISANRHTEPAKLTKLMRGELDWIVMKTLEKDRSRRYETANGFAADVQRYLNDEPVQACPPSAMYKFRKFVRRNKRVLLTTSVVVLAVLLLVGSVGWMVRDRAAREEANVLEQTVHQAKVEEEVIRALGESESFYKRDKLPDALADLKRAEGMLASGGGSAELQQRVHQWRTDLEMVGRLDEIRLHPASVNKDGNFDTGSNDLAYQQAFRQYGLDVEALSADAAAERIKSSAIRDTLLAAVDDWVISREVTQNRRSTDGLLAVARRADADPQRNRLRNALEARDQKALQEMARDPEALAQTSATISLLGRALFAMHQTTLAIDVLRQAQSRHPGDFWINQNLASYYFLVEPTQAREAVGFYRAALALRPESFGVHHNLGCALHKEKQWSKAETEFREAIRLKPDFAKAHAALGEVLRAQSRLDEAIAACESAIALDPKSAPAHNHLGNALFDRGRPEAAIAAYEMAIGLDPKFAMAHYNLGNVFRGKGQLDAAIVAYEKAIALDPKYAAAHANLGGALRIKGRLDAAIASFRKAIELDPEDAPAHSNLGGALRANGQLDDAIAAYETAIAVDRKYAPAHSNLGLALQDKGRVDAAIASYRKAIELDPQFAQAHLALGIVLCDRKQDYLGAVAAFRKAISLEPDLLDAHFNFGLALWLHGDGNQALAAFRDATRLQPTNARAHTYLARCLTTCSDLKLRNPREALEAAKKGMELAPKSDLAWLMLGWANYRSREWKASIAALEKSIALQKAPKDGDPRQWFVLAMAHWQLDQKDEGRKWYDRAGAWMDKYAPQNVELRLFRAEAAELLGLKEK